MGRGAGGTGGGGGGGRAATAWIGAGLAAINARRASRLRDRAWWAANTASVQAVQLRRLLSQADRTEIGRTHGFAKLARLGDGEIVRAFRASMPAGDYESFRSRMERMREGAEPDVTWPGIIMDWAQTSGTTGGQKYIPVSAEMMASNRRAALDLFAYASGGGGFGVSLPSLFSGKLLFVGGSTKLDTSDKGIRTGDLSGLVTPLISWPLSMVYSPGADIALLDHWPTKIDAMARRTMSQDVRFVSGMASWSLVLFERVVELAREQRGNPRLALRDVWPNLTLFIHGGVKYPPFDPRVREAWSGDPSVDVPHRLEVYPASEGFIAVQDTANDPGLRLNTDSGIFYEFIPLDRIDELNPPAYSAHEVEKGVRYVVVMTTCAGLWRYIIGDVVVFDTVPPEGPARLRIVGRHRHFINAFGENLIVEEIERAVVAARDAMGVRVGEFTASPVYPGPGRRGALELVIEWDAPADRAAAFGETFDRHLRTISVDYNIKRTDSLGMAPPTVTTVPMGAFHAWMASRGKLGGQHKCPRCANDRAYVDGLRAIVGLRPHGADTAAPPAAPAPASPRRTMEGAHP